MILSFKKQFPWKAPTNFEQRILSGSKIHTIREDPHGRWKAGRKIHFATGVRTKNYNCFKEGVCTSVQSIHINYFIIGAFIKRLDIVIDGRIVLNRDCEITDLLAINDGFNLTENFFKWFDSDFSGKIIHWTDFRY